MEYKKLSIKAIVLAAGKGESYHSQKQFLAFYGKALWRHVYDTICSILPKENVVVVGVDIPGGETRSGSVKNGLNWLSESGGCKKVIIFEAARALVMRKQIMDIIDADSPSVCFVKPVFDTVILKDKTYLNRSDCLHIVSPQAFDFDLLFKAYKNADLSELRTDETRLMNDVGLNLIS